MSLLYAFTFQDGGNEGCRERIACTYGIFNLYLGSGLKRYFVGRENVATIYSLYLIHI